MSETVPARRGWRWIRPRLSVRALMATVLVLGVGLGWAVERARVQHEAIAAIHRAGGSAFYDFQEANSHARSPSPLLPRWMIAVFGVDCFASVVRVQIEYWGENPGVDDAVMARIGGLGRLKFLDLYRQASVNDAMLSHLSGLRQLRELSLIRTGVRGPGLVYLRRLTRLKELHLTGQPVTDADLAPLARLTALEELSLTDTNVTDSGLTHLRGLTGLKRLRLTRCRVTSAGLTHLGKMAGLKELYLDGTRVKDLTPLRPLAALEQLDLDQLPIGDADLDPVLGLRRLWFLGLNRTRVGDEGLERLASLPELKLLPVHKTRVTVHGIKEFGRTRPNVIPP